MKCTACGLPLSPTRANGNCPRCGTPASGAAKSTGGPVGWNDTVGAPTSVGAPPRDGQWGQARLASPAFQQPMVLPPQVGQAWGAGANGMQGPGTFSPMPPAPRRPPRKPRLGFLVAGVCVCAGGLLLVVVYFLAIGQPNNSPTTGNTPTRTAATSTAAVTPSLSGSPSPAATTYPGQQYISNAQMSSTQPPAQPATSFKVNQTLYVVFKVSSSTRGEVCMKWYLNGKFAFNYQFPIGAHATFTTYGQAIYSTPGPAYVELYWAGDSSCANELLAQHVDFTITT
jgi:hypothetical protein